MKTIIIGGGPSGLRAAITLAGHGLKPILLDEAARPGGQGYRTPAPGIALDIDKLMGSQSEKYNTLHRDFARQSNAIDYRPDTTVWAIDGQVLHLEHRGNVDQLHYDALIIASGATDRIFPVSGWTLPGVFSLGGSQIALKDQGTLIGRRVAFVGSSPLLGLVAQQYQAMGASIAGVFDTTPFTEKINALPQLMYAPDVTLRGVGYLAQLRLAGVSLHFGLRPLRIQGEASVEGLILQDRTGQEIAIACDTIALGYGVKPETQLAELAGAKFSFDNDFRLWLPEIDEDGRAFPNLFLVGDGARIGGADAAEASGRLAALALLSDQGHRVAQAEIDKLRRTVRKLRSFQRGLAKAFAWPYKDANQSTDSTILCRCENVSVGEVRNALSAALIPPEINRVKAITRCGMGRCQGRMCGPALQEIIASHSKVPIASVGRLRGQAPVKPIPLSAAQASS